MNEQSKNEHSQEELEALSKHTLHGLEDAAEIVGHGAAGAIKGIADGVESASAQSEVRKSEASKED